MISIITPVLNGGKYIKKNIESILSLTIPYEHIVVDGGSIDDTLKIISKYEHIKLIEQKEQLGMYHAVDLGFEKAKGKYIAWINSDDQVLVDGFEKMYNKIVDNNSDMVYSNAYQLYESNGVIKKVYGKIFPKIYLKNKIMPFVQPSSIYKKNIYCSVGGFNIEKYKIIADIDLFMRIAKKPKIKILRCDAFSSIFVNRGESFGHRNTSLSVREAKTLPGMNGCYVFRPLVKILYKINDCIFDTIGKINLYI